jgi:hypothetical protein
MATSTRTRRAAAPSAPPADAPARNDAAAKKPAASKKPAAKKPAAAPGDAAPATSRKMAAKTAAKTAVKTAVEAAVETAASPAGSPGRAPAARKTTTPTGKAAAKTADRAPEKAPTKGSGKAPAKSSTKPSPMAPAKLPAGASAKKTAARKPGPVPDAAPTAAPAPESADKAAAAPPATARKPAAGGSAAKGQAARKAAAPAPAKKSAGRGRSRSAPESGDAVALPEGPAAEAHVPAPAPAPASTAVSAPAHVPAPSAAPVLHELPTHAHSAVVLQDGEHRQLRWIAGRDCPDALRAAATSCTDETGQLQLDDDDALPSLLREAARAGHALQVDPAAWQQLARRRDARRRLFALEQAYPDGPASAALRNLLRAPLAPFQAEGALFAACAGRALLADERGLGKTVQALAAAMLLHRHAGVERVLVHCSADQRLSWQREAARFLGSAAPEWRVVSDEPGGPHTDAIDAWKPGLVVIDEPARLARWDRIDAPFALVLCGTPLEGDAELAEALVDYLDRHREGPLARLRARRDGETLDEALQALMLRRRRAEVQPQLPARVVSERVLPLAALQRAVHDRAAASARAVLAGWRRTRHLPDAQQWELGSAMQAMREACHRAEPGRSDSALAEHTISALIVLTSELLGHAGLRIAAIAPRPADAALMAERLAQAGQGGGRCAVVPAGQALPADAEVVIAIGMPWQPPVPDDRPRQWIHLLAEQSIDTALYDTRELREGIACTPAEGGHDGFLHGAALQRYLLAAEAALRALPDQPTA